MGDHSNEVAIKKVKRNLVEMLNNLVEDSDRDADKRVKTGQRQLADNSASILTNTVLDQKPSALGVLPCRVSQQSLDGRGRAQRAMRVDGIKVNFRPWHITWISANGKAPVDNNNAVEYSHRCHQENCVEPSHGVWESGATNKDRWSCRTCSHIILPNGKCVQLCGHNPCCLVPVTLTSWDDPRVVDLPLTK